MIKLELPIYYTKIYKTKKAKKILVSANWYRNAHYFEQNEVKKYYHKTIYKALAFDLGNIRGLVGVKYGLYYKNASSDLMNVGAIIDKFLMDSLQEMGIIENDNVKHYIKSEFEVIGQDRDNPRMITEIYEVGEEE